MMTTEELEDLRSSGESDRVEFKESAQDLEGIRRTVCAFANDMPNHREPGVVFVGIRNDGRCAGLDITDELSQRLANVHGDGNIVPPQTIYVTKTNLRDCEVACVIVEPSKSPPVRCGGRVYVRVGSTTQVASREDERRLSERSRAADVPFDVRPVETADLHDIDTDRITREYLHLAVAPDILARNDREFPEQLAALRLVSPSPPNHPTYLGLLVFGTGPTDFIPGAYLQFLRIDGIHLTDSIINQAELHGPLPDLIRRLDEILRANNRTASDVSSETTEIRLQDYPIVALQQLTRNALMHRDYESSNAPVRVTWYNDRIEIQNPGGPFGQVTRKNFGRPGITDYRNPNLAGALKDLGFVQRFGMGIALAQQELSKNGNPELRFDVQVHHVLVTVRVRQ